MREDLLNELTAEYEAQRARNDREEAARRERIRREYPEIQRKVAEREELVFGTIRGYLNGNAKAENLSGKMAELNENISRMLQDCGLPADYLEPVYRCALCRDTGYTGELIRDPCDCLKKAYQEKLREKVAFEYWEKADDTHTVVRFATSWSTTEDDLLALKEALEQ